MKKIKTVRRQANQKKEQYITKEMTISEIMKKYPKTVFVFIDYGLHCIGCPMSLPETVEEAARLHRVDFKKFLKDLNAAANKS